jgi:hypothetical protein
MTETLILKTEITVTEEDIDDIMCTALEGGINHWAVSATCERTDHIDYTHEALSQGSPITIKVFDEQREEHVLTKEKFMKGLQKAADEGRLYWQDPGDGLELDVGAIDAEIADVIVQYAIFGDIVYG